MIKEIPLGHSYGAFSKQSLKKALAENGWYVQCDGCAKIDSCEQIIRDKILCAVCAEGVTNESEGH